MHVLQIESPPWALGKLLEHMRLNYGNPPVMIHENGRHSGDIYDMEETFFER